jgi:flagellar hook protein FlgE
MVSAVSALRSHQTYMDVISTNIANVNTTGYKGARVSFIDALSQTMRGSTPPTSAKSGLNPAQVGLGVQLGAIDITPTQGDLLATGKTTDVAIEGDGFFVLSDGSKRIYSRDGSFDVSADGFLVSPATGARVQGWMPNAAGVVDSSGPISDISIPMESITPGRTTSTAGFTGNLDARAPIYTTTPAVPAGSEVRSTLVVYDSLGMSHNITLTLQHTAANTWTWAPSTTETGVAVTGGGSIVFDTSGKVTSGGTPNMSITYSIPGANVTSPQTLSKLDFLSVTQMASSSEVNMTSQDGFAAGILTHFEISANGEVAGIYSNGLNRPLGQLAVARLQNPSGLIRVGGNAFIESSNSGQALVGVAGTGGRGTLAGGSLEMSNVDLSQQFTNMIMAQRGFQANSRIITTSDEMLQELINLKR